MSLQESLFLFGICKEEFHQLHSFLECASWHFRIIFDLIYCLIIDGGGSVYQIALSEVVLYWQLFYCSVQTCYLQR